MNANEVIANRANEILNVGARGEYAKVNPNDHVNMAQSTNDVFPTAMRIAALMQLKELYPVLDRLQSALPTLNGEIQLTDSIAATCRSAGVSAVRYDGRRFDCGNFAGLLQANIAVSQLDEAPVAAPMPPAQPAATQPAAAEASAA